MPSRFIQLTLDEFADLLRRFPFTRRIDAVHMHHTWRPNHADYRGEATIEAMWRVHTQENNWLDIAQHISIAPDGTIWTGRDWNLPPASAVGYNGDRVAGPFMFETIGDFDEGCDRLEGAQRDAVIGVIARVQERFALGLDSLRFHRQMTDRKSCPGTALDLDEVRAAVQRARTALATTRAARRGEAWAGIETLRVRERSDQVIRLWEASTPGARDLLDAEPVESQMSEEHGRPHDT
jgi:N-acetylmuramoyl-L-alanine amidase-like protein